MVGGGGSAKMAPSLKSVTHILQWWNMAQLYLTWRRPKKYMNHVTLPPGFCWHQHFLPEISKFCYIRKYRYRFHFCKKLEILLTFFEYLKKFLINVVTILIMPAKLATLGLLKIKIFWSKGYDVIIPGYDVTDKIWLRDLRYIVDLIMWPKFGNSSISMRSYHNLNFIRIWKEKPLFFEGWPWLKFNNLGLALGMALKFYTGLAKGLK